jgi:hypothetical protein
VPLWTETACRFPPKPPAGLNRNRLSETPKFADWSPCSLTGRKAGIRVSLATHRAWIGKSGLKTALGSRVGGPQGGPERWLNRIFHPIFHPCPPSDKDFNELGSLGGRLMMRRAPLTTATGVSCRRAIGSPDDVYISAVRGLPLGGTRGKRIRDGVALLRDQTFVLAGSDRDREGLLAGLERTRLQWVRTDAIDPKETFSRSACACSQAQIYRAIKPEAWAWAVLDSDAANAFQKQTPVSMILLGRGARTREGQGAAC